MLRSFRRKRVRVNDPGPGEAVLATDSRFSAISTESTWRTPCDSRVCVIFLGVRVYTYGGLYTIAQVNAYRLGAVSLHLMICGDSQRERCNSPQLHSETIISTLETAGTLKNQRF